MTQDLEARLRNAGDTEAADALQRYREENERLRVADMFWDPDNPEAPMNSPFDEMDDWGRPNGIVHEVWCARKLPSVFVAQLPPREDADSDDEWTCEAANREAAQTMLDAELSARAALNPKDATDD